MYLITDQFVASNKALAETMIGIAQIQFSEMQRLSALGFNTGKSAIEDMVEHGGSLLHARDVQEFINLNTALSRPSLEKSVAYSRNCYEVATQAQGEFSKLMETQASDMTRRVTSFLDTLSKNAPAGSEAATAAVKSAFAAASSAYDSLNRISKQATELAVANFSAATESVNKENKKKAA